MDKLSKSNKPITRREGKRVRWAKNIIKQWLEQPREQPYDHHYWDYYWGVVDEIKLKRYGRAVALIVAHKLSQ